MSINATMGRLREWLFFSILFIHVWIVTVRSDTSRNDNEAKDQGLFDYPRLPADYGDYGDYFKEYTQDDYTDDLWLEDMTSFKDYMDEMQADSAGPNYFETSFTCPRPAESPSLSSCLRQQCLLDLECSGPHQRCCNNGCVQTCVAGMPPPPVVDWVREPPRRLESGNSWLIKNPNSLDEDSLEESCSTTPLSDGSDQLLCPHGYTCHITDPGDREKGVPNSGSCEPNTPNQPQAPNQIFHLRTEMQQKGGCLFDNAIFPEGASFTYENHPCTCQEGSITCRVV